MGVLRLQERNESPAADDGDPRAGRALPGRGPGAAGVDEQSGGRPAPPQNRGEIGDMGRINRALYRLHWTGAQAPFNRTWPSIPPSPE